MSVTFLLITPKLVTTRRSILGPPAEGRPGPSYDNDEPDGGGPATDFDDDYEPDDGAADDDFDDDDDGANPHWPGLD